jgi:hypothetical protein
MGRNAYTDSRQPELDEGRSAIDRRHVQRHCPTSSISRQEPSRARSSAAGSSTIAQASTGYPYTTFAVRRAVGNGNSLERGMGTQRRTAGWEPCQASGSSLTCGSTERLTVNGAAIGSATPRHDRRARLLPVDGLTKNFVGRAHGPVPARYQHLRPGQLPPDDGNAD